MQARNTAVIELGKRRKIPMAYKNDNKIYRTSNGSIDYAHYDRRARRIRGEDFSGIVSRLFGHSARRTS